MQIGCNVTILPNVLIGNNVIIGACAVVTKDLPDNSVVAGIPARVISSIENFRSKHKDVFLMIKNRNEKEKRELLFEYLHEKNNNIY